MKKHSIKFETIRFPLIILFLSMLLRGLSNTILTEPMISMVKDSYPIILTVSETTKFFSGVVIRYFPFIIAIKVLAKRHNSERLILMFILSYFLLLSITTIMGKIGMAEIVYDDLFGMKSIVNSNIVDKEVMRTAPFRLGFIGVFISGYIADISFRMTRTRTKYGFLPYIEKDVLALVLTLFFTALIGTGLVIIWPMFLEVIFKVFEWIANDITNPISTFIYGFIDRIFSVLDLSEINRQSFWYSSFGGSWMNDLGENFTGDVNIWSQQIQSGIFDSGFGRFITPYYIINLFAVPATSIGIYSMYTSKKNRLEQLAFLILIIIVSFFADLSLPLEIFLLVMAPLLYFYHVFIVAGLFALLQGIKLYLGVSAGAPLVSPTLGSGLDLYNYFSIEALQQNVIYIIIIGIFIALIYFFSTRFYYNYLSLGLINKIEIEIITDEVLEVVGGIENIKKIDSSPFRLDIQLNRPELFNYELLKDTQITRVIETRSSYALYYGTASTIIQKEINKRILLLND